jgi:hypothetical protein
LTSHPFIDPTALLPIDARWADVVIISSVTQLIGNLVAMLVGMPVVKVSPVLSKPRILLGFLLGRFAWQIAWQIAWHGV